MAQRKIAALLPTAYRPERLTACLESLFDQRLSHTGVELRIVVSPIEDDRASRAILERYPVRQIVRTPEEYARGAVYGWNTCLLPELSADMYLLAADDLDFEEECLARAVVALDSLGEGLVGLNDLHSDGDLYAAHWLVSRNFLIDYLGGVMYPPLYKSWWCDREVTDIAQREGKYRYAKSAIAAHHNYSFGVSEVDRTYREAMPNYAADEALYRARKADGFPLTWEPIIKRSS